MNIKRHGDLVITTTDKIPETAKKVMSGDINKLALGEFTGHSHKLKTDVVTDVYEDGDSMYYVVDGVADLFHEEHKTIRTITDKPLVFKRTIKKEFDYFSGELRAVRD